jgi:hypothetical protein
MKCYIILQTTYILNLMFSIIYIYIYNLRMWMFKYGTKTFVTYHIQDMESFAMSDSFI